MEIRKLLERDVVIRLTETGFIETTRYFALAECGTLWEVLPVDWHEEDLQNFVRPLRRASTQDPLPDQQ